MSGDEILKAMESEEGLERALAREEVLIYKHGPRGWKSFMAIGQVRRFALDHPDVPVRVVDVTEEDDLARRVENRLRVPRESPQVILVRDGEPVWHTSHLGVRYRAIESALAD